MRTAALACVIGLAGCSKPAEVVVPGLAAAPAVSAAAEEHDHGALVARLYQWSCDDGTTLRMDNLIERDAVVLYLPEGMVTLPHAESASGARYADESIQFWTHDDEQALFQRRPDPAIRCVIASSE